MQLVYTNEGIVRLDQGVATGYSGSDATYQEYPTLFGQRLSLSADDGRTWDGLSPLPDLAPGPSNAETLVVASAAPSTLFVVGPNKRLLYSSDGGHSWQQYKSSAQAYYITPYVPLTLLAVQPTQPSDPSLLTPLPGHPTPAPGATALPNTYPQEALYALDLPEAGRTLSSAALPLNTPGSTYFPQTGHNISGVFKQYWEANGGLTQQGYPLTEAFPQVSDTDGSIYETQYFERAVFELHPENQPPYNVLLGLLGTDEYKTKYGSAGAPNQHASTDNPLFFTKTGHALGGRFRQYWEQHGGLAQQGYPISDEFTEVSPVEGKSYTVQYFQRAEFELHPEFAGTPNEVLLSQLGAQQFNARYNSNTPKP
jgi:hypothetical protein